MKKRYASRFYICFCEDKSRGNDPYLAIFDSKEKKPIFFTLCSSFEIRIKIVEIAQKHPTDGISIDISDLDAGVVEVFGIKTVKDTPMFINVCNALSKGEVHESGSFIDGGNRYLS